jgi:uncharacterized protein
MKHLLGTLRLSATDLSNHLTCSHLTQANLAYAHGERTPPPFAAPDAAILAQRGLEHERAYVQFLQQSGNLTIADLSTIKSEPEAVSQTQKAIAAGVDVIVQAALTNQHWFGRPDILRKTANTATGVWSYEPYDCKLAAETKAATILQLLHYAALLASTQQGRESAYVHVVPPSFDFAPETYRVLDYAAYFRSIQSRLETAIQRRPNIYPEPIDHCEICRWRPDCDRRRRADDHLCLTAGITRLQRKQLFEWEVPTLEDLSRLTIPLTRKPRHGSKDSYVRIREQARIQVAGRYQKAPVHELLPLETGCGLTRLPEPSPADIFFDLESDPFAGPHGREYLFGFTTADGQYQSRWALTPAEEKSAFEWFIDFAMTRWQAHAALHIYHYGHKEPSTLKTLMGRYATREDELDRMLRAGLLIDLHSITKQSLRASVERYSLKTLEEFHHFQREVTLEGARHALHLFEHALELGREEVSDPALRRTISGYNADDCKSTHSLRDWLETLRAQQGSIPRPAMETGDPSEQVSDRQARVQELTEKLLQKSSPDQPAYQLLANLLDWHRRESKSEFHEKYRLQELGPEELQDERAAISGLTFLRAIPPTGRKKSHTHEYSFPTQETNLAPGDQVYAGKETIGTIESINPVKGLVAIRRNHKTAAIQPQSIYSYKIVGADEQADSLIRLAESVLDNGFQQTGPFKAALDLLLRCPANTGPLHRPNEEPLDSAKRLIANRALSVLAIQGPPGSGKTYTAARMIVECLRLGLKIGVSAGSHKVIRKLLGDVQIASFKPVNCLHKITGKSDKALPPWLTETTNNPEAFTALQSRHFQILAGTAWLWSRPEAISSVDVLFVDEAGQMSLANALAIAPATNTLVLLGDPQQLEQPLKGSHPDGADVSALQHLLEDAKTMPAHRGLFLDKTRRLHPSICRFTSEMFYDNRLESVASHTSFGQTGLRFVPVAHEGNQNSSIEEVEKIAEIVQSLLTPGVTQDDILIVAPYNAQVALLSQRLPPGMHIGTVDKFQGQEAPVVIYSLTTSTPEDAPRGMEFLYSLNRLNVATSRAQALCILVASPKLLEPHCKTPRQLQLANALCRYVELSEQAANRGAGWKPAADWQSAS